MPTQGPSATAQPTATQTPRPTATPVPTPTPRPEGHEASSLLAGTPWETQVSIRSSGLDGPRVVVLGGVHGNEPGGWFAADQIATWIPAAGALAVVPRANVLAIARFQRLIDGEGDLNRQYPGDPDSELPTSRLAAGITELCRDMRAEVVLDLHESWAFYVDREAAGFQNRQQAGTAFLGQTITAGPGPRAGQIASQLAGMVNESIPSVREHMIPRDGAAFGRNDGAPAGMSRGSSSLSLGGHVPGLTPVLVETAQQGQEVSRRTELHLRVVRATLDILGM